jgi:endonuclease/exonuclease/phosphatase family metal-dependent hydrolase
MSCRSLVTSLLLAASCLLLLAPGAAADEATSADSDAAPLRCMTFNIRYGTANDGDDSWPLRRELVFDTIRDFAPDILGVQEALPEQLDELRAALPEFGCIGIGREADGSGEYSAIFYRTARLDVAACDTWWLSATPETPGSRTWGNTLPRICTWARLLDRRDGSRFTLINTHWDHQSEPARLESGRLIAQWVAERFPSDEPCIVTGDFNASEESPAIAALCGGTRPLRDTFRELHPDEEAGTFHGFRGRAGSS